MRIKTVSSKWLYREELRLDSKPYMSGAMEAKAILEELPMRKNFLKDLTTGHEGGIFNGPQFSRVWVNDPDYGVPFLGSSRMLLSDFSNLPLLRKKDAYSAKLSHLKLKPGMTLISCSGTVGRMAYVHSEMKDIWSSQHIMKIQAKLSEVQPGYIYAYLSSKYGVPQVISGTYGAIIQHIEPRHLEKLQVPRFSEETEKEISFLVDSSAKLLAEFQIHVRQASKLFFESVGLKEASPKQWHREGSDIGFKQDFPVLESFRAVNFNPRFKQICEAIKKGEWLSLDRICLLDSLKRGGGRIKRIDAEPEFAYKFIGQKQLFSLRPEGRWLAKGGLNDDVLVPPGTILVPAQGTLGESELFCRAEFIWGVAVERAYSEHLLRITADESKMLRGCLFAFMRSETAFRMLRSLAVGTKLQDHHYAFLPKLPIPVPSREDQEVIHQKVVRAYENRDKAVALEDRAIALVEKAIEETA